MEVGWLRVDAPNTRQAIERPIRGLGNRYQDRFSAEAAAPSAASRRQPLLNLQIGKAGSQSSLEEFDVHDVLVEHFQPLFPAPNLGIGVAKHCRTVFGPCQIVIYVVASNDCRTRENIVNSCLETYPLIFGLVQGGLNCRGDGLYRSLSVSASRSFGEFETHCPN
jgi:hypothetical protein